MIGNIPNVTKTSKANASACEDHFVTTIACDEDGQLNEKLPLIHKRFHFYGTHKLLHN